ncbi:MAG TPA: phosphoenolpyruvate synthase [Lacunisphaera sp.]
MNRHIRWFSEVGIADLPLVGGKNASLGEMYRELTARGIRVPNGFATTAEAFRDFLRVGELGERINAQLAGLDTRNIADLRERCARIRDAILGTELPAGFAADILAAYDALSGPGRAAAVAVRSSATAEDLPDASFAGQQETFLNVRGHHALLEACRRCFASLFKDRAVSYRVDQGFDHAKVALSIGVQLMVRSDLGSAGVIFTLDTESGFRDAVLISAAYGLGENVVQGTVTPDEYCVFKPTLRQGFKPILRKVAGSKEFKLVYDTGGSKQVRNVPVPPAERARFALGDDDILQLARWACLIEDHYSAKRGAPTPMDLEWARDGETGALYILQARPETVQSRRNPAVIETFRLRAAPGPALVTGRSIGDRIATGPVRLIRSAQHLERFNDGEILVTDKTDPDWEPILKKAAAVVTDRGGRTCHAAIVSRELGVPAIVGTERGTAVLHDGQVVTVCCAEGEVGGVYAGALPFAVERTDLQAFARPRTKVMMNVGNPDEAFGLSFIPNDGAGLVRMEFIISNSIRIHPLALVDPAPVADPGERRLIAELTAGYADKPAFFVDRLAQGVALIAAAFYPKDVIVRLSDFKTNEYANLIGGRSHEPVEENPMLGFRGASRYYHPRYQAGFALECRAMRRVREVMGLTNVKLMIPFCRTVEEGRRVQAEMAKHGLIRGVNGLEIYVMCEIPSNAILAAEFAEIFDGFSIGSNDLTQLILGVDRDSEIVAPLFDERNPAVQRMIADVIAACRARGRKIGICGQAPSDYPEFARFLVAQGIDSISLNPDTVLKTSLAIREQELAMARDAAP